MTHQARPFQHQRAGVDRSALGVVLQILGKSVEKRQSVEAKEKSDRPAQAMRRHTGPGRLMRRLAVGRGVVQIKNDDAHGAKSSATKTHLYPSAKAHATYADTRRAQGPKNGGKATHTQ